MSESYRVMSNDNDEIERVFETEMSGKSTKSALGRCFDFLICRRNSSAMLVIVDVLFLISTLWLYGDILVAITTAKMLPDASAWWLYAILAIPPVLQWICIVLRVRYVCVKEQMRAQVDWHIKHMIRPMNILIANGFACSVFLFVLPLYGAALHINEELPVPPVTPVFLLSMWQITASTVSSVFFTLTFSLASVANWLVSVRHSNSVKVYVTLQEKAVAERRNAVTEYLTPGTIDLKDLAGEEIELSVRPIATFHEPPAPVLSHPSNTFSTNFTQENEYNNAKPRPSGSKKKQRGDKHKTVKFSNVNRMRNIGGTKVLPPLDHSTHSGGKEDQWGRVYSNVND